MLPKASQRVANVIKIANGIAREHDLEYVGTEHLLMAIRRDGTGLGAAILEKHGVSEARLNEVIEQVGKKQLEETWVFGRLPGTPHYRNVMARAIDQCQELGASEICTEHLLLGLLGEEGSIASNALKELGLNRETIRADLAEMTS